MHKHTRSHTICSVTALNGKTHFILSNKSFIIQLMQPSRWQEQMTNTPGQSILPQGDGHEEALPTRQGTWWKPKSLIYCGLTKTLCLKSLTEDEQQCWQAQDRAGKGTTFEELCSEPLFGFTSPVVKLMCHNPSSFWGCCVLSSPLTCDILHGDPLQFEK